MPRLTAGPFRYSDHADSYLDVALRYASVPGEAGGHLALGPEPACTRPTRSPATRASSSSTTCSREHETEVRGCLQSGAHGVQIDFTEGRLAVKIDPSGELLQSFIDLNNLVLAGSPTRSAARIGVHTCPGGDRDSTHSADVDYAELLPSLFQLQGRATSTSRWRARRTAPAC